MPRGTELVKSILETVIKTPNFGQCLKNVKVLTAGDGQCKAEFTVSEEHLNLGVSVDLHVTFMKAAFPGEVVTVDAKTIRAGNNVAFLAVDLTKNDGKDIIAHGRHTKFLAK
ncbi:hypothetical protein KM043_017474 [Ampulex compressa]|nr:hypothetical protein KM043_017474 [Ampulex compressa]